MIYCESIADHFGIDDVAGIAALYSGANNQTTRKKPAGATEGTSRASKAMRNYFKQAKFPYGIKLPTGWWVHSVDSKVSNGIESECVCWQDNTVNRHSDISR